MSEANYHAERVDARCDWSISCYPAVYPTFEACEADWSEPDDGGEACTYDGAAAKECVDALRTAQCPADGDAPATPEACTLVFTDCADAA